MKTWADLVKTIYRVFARVYPQCSMIAQAIAFNVFLAFFPTLLLAVGFATSWIGNRTALLDAIRDFTQFLPPGSQSIVSDFLGRRGPDAWKFAILGWGGTLLGGSQVMKLLTKGIHLIYGEEEGTKDSSAASCVVFYCFSSPWHRSWRPAFSASSAGRSVIG